MTGGRKAAMSQKYCPPLIMKKSNIFTVKSFQSVINGTKKGPDFIKSGPF